MEFVEYKLPRGVATNANCTVRFCCYKTKNGISYMAYIRINRQLCDLMQLQRKDFVKLFFDDQQPNLWMIKKSEDGFRISSYAKSYAISCKLNSIPAGFDHNKLYKTDHTITDDGLIIEIKRRSKTDESE